MNALHGKFAWNYLKQRSLWTRFAKTRFTVGKLGSPIWNSISRHITRLRYRSCWEVGYGSNHIEKYLWHFDIPCRSYLAGYSIKDVLAHHRRRLIFMDGVPEIARAYNNNATSADDNNQLRWTGAGNGEFTSKNYPNVITGLQQKEAWGEIIWQQWIRKEFLFL